jgi:hypothetical protein
MRALDLQYNTEVRLRKLASIKLKVPELSNYYEAQESIVIEEPFHIKVDCCLIARFSGLCS